MAVAAGLLLQPIKYIAESKIAAMPVRSLRRTSNLNSKGETYLEQYLETPFIMYPIPSAILCYLLNTYKGSYHRQTLPYVAQNGLLKKRKANNKSSAFRRTNYQLTILSL